MRVKGATDVILIKSWLVDKLMGGISKNAPQKYGDKSTLKTCAAVL